ncbi:glycoside hydrolase 43 family protein [Chitinophaga horti]|uniref:Glycoside hydrolase 43 family protein n=2 Tax=Chitinophaga horti TaxID=2920382 RepID=A0ABY6J9G3_9BACT|nr:glycoside hydrolase 43 family protein [Chitinophaga horti]UYQ95971.1 glycoside hydrolase 43 family protein [Chitinophaga horti]
MKALLLAGGLTAPLAATAQQQALSKVWVADNGNGTYKNPVINADYSDPDAIRVGNDFYMISSSFNMSPGLPILHSKDLVNWTLIGHALQRQIPFEHFSKVQHGNGVWAPAIRYHRNEFYIYYPDPDFGIYMTKASSIKGPWSDPVLVAPGSGLIDPCPYWDTDGKAYLVHAYAGSRAGIKSLIVLKRMNAEGTKVLDGGTIVFDGHNQDPTLEGPKMHKRNGYYYILAPAGGVSTGWQLALRSKNIYGPYERKVVMDQGSSAVNGPHQGAWVNTAAGEDWFLHFQDKDAYGRVVHLQPMKWVNDWPVIGEDKDGDGKGTPVSVYKKPATGAAQPKATPGDSDEFDGLQAGLQWQWQANPSAYWSHSNMSEGVLRLFAIRMADSSRNLWNVPNLLLQKFPADAFTATAKLRFRPRQEGDRAGLVILGVDYAQLSLVMKDSVVYLEQGINIQADKGKKEMFKTIGKAAGRDIWLRVSVAPGAICKFSYSDNGKDYTDIPGSFTARPGRWVGAKVGLFAVGTMRTNDAGWVDADWFRIE